MFKLLTTAQMGEADSLTIAAGMPGLALMEKAGAAVANVVARTAGERRGPIVVLAGPGNNGGDGFVCARLLAARGRAVRVCMIGDAGRLSGDAAAAAAQWTGVVEPWRPELLVDASAIVDALLGAGLSRPVEGEVRTVIECINTANVPVVAVDLPSGIHGDTGQVMGEAVHADATVTLFRRKPGHLLLPGRLHCGETIVADIGIAASVLDRITPTAFANCPALWGSRFPVPQPAGHKYSRGHAVVVSGGASSTGAARLAARAALRSGAGVVTIAGPREAVPILAVSQEAAMVRAVDDVGAFADWLQDPRINAVVLGPGGGVGPNTRDLVLAALGGPRAVVLDADALTSFADQPDALFRAIHQRGDAFTILTPHEGEFSRLFGKSPEGADKTKINRARIAARRSGATVLLKGSDTVVAVPDGRATIAENAPPWLATAGSGDVLAGMVAGLLAQGMAGFDAANAATWLHGETGNEVGPGLIAEDLPEAVPRVYRRLFADLRR